MTLREDWATGEGVNAAVMNAIGAAVNQEVRTGIYQFELPAGLTTFGGSIALTLRERFKLTQSPLRFRVHFRNRNHLGNANATATLANFTCWVGAAAENSDGNLTGAFTTTPIQIQTSTTITNGTELVTPWVSPATFTIEPYKNYLLSFAFTTGASDQVGLSGGQYWYSLSNTDAGLTSPSVTSVENQGYLAKYIEFEFANDAAKVMLVVSSSLAGCNVVAPQTTRGELSSFSQKWALANRGVVANLSVAGAWAADFAAASAKWDYYSGLNTALAPNRVLLLATNSSDIGGGSGSAGDITIAKNNEIAAIMKARALWPTAEIIGSTNPPRGEAAWTGAVEAARVSVNTWLTSCPSGMDQCIDLEPLLSNGASPARLQTAVNCGDDVHWNENGHARVAQAIPA